MRNVMTELKSKFSDSLWTVFNEDREGFNREYTTDWRGGYIHRDYLRDMLQEDLEDLEYFYGNDLIDVPPSDVLALIRSVVDEFAQAIIEKYPVYH